MPTLLANSVSLNLDRNQGALQTSVTRLSSGLRINTAADDPSGLAISSQLQSQVDGFNAAVGNVQSASNAATVADGALQTTTDILQRIRTLAVEASSDITSQSQKADLQTEVNALLLEVNRISQNTNFNGAALLDGSHAGYQPQQDAFLTVEANAALASNGGIASASGINSGLLVATAVASSVNFATTVGYTYAVVQGEGSIGSGVVNGSFTAQTLAPNTIGAINVPVPTGFTATGAGVNLFNGNSAQPPLPAGQQGVVLQQGGGGLNQVLTGLTPGASYEISFEAGSYSGGSTVQVQANGTTVLTVTPPTTGYTSYTTATFVAPGSGDVSLQLTNIGGHDLSLTSLQVASAGATGDGTIELQVVNTGVSIAAQETFFDSATGQAYISPTLFGANGVAGAFDNVNVTLGAFSTADVGVSSYIKVSQNVASASNPNQPAFSLQSGSQEGATIQVGFASTDTATLRISNINLLLSSSSSPSLGAEDAIGQIHNALQRLLAQRAQLGAVVVRLNEDVSNDNTTAVNLQASESNIRDLNVGSETTNFTRLQILVSVGTSVLSQSHANAQSVLGLFR